MSREHITNRIKINAWIINYFLSRSMYR